MSSCRPLYLGTMTQVLTFNDWRGTALEDRLLERQDKTTDSNWIPIEIRPLFSAGREATIGLVVAVVVLCRREAQVVYDATI